MNSYQSLIIRPILITLLFLAAADSHGQAPPFTDYCEMLARDIQGEHYGFLAGNKQYYVAGSFGADWEEYWESETIGFTHPVFRDGRARGHGIVDEATGGTGHDAWGWEFWRQTRGAYGTVVVDGKSFKHPTPKATWWRPDRQICEYNVGGVAIREEKFISNDDVLCDIITADRDIEVLFEGESYINADKVPTFDGDPPNLTFTQRVESEVKFDQANNTLRLTEAGTVMTKPSFGEKVRVGRMMYDGLNFAITSSHPLTDIEITKTPKGNLKYQFRIRIPAGESVALLWSVDDDYAKAMKRARAVAADPVKARDAKTGEMNTLLNEQIPYFRCSDPLAVKTYYYLWSLYFMYFRDVQDGYQQFPHTQTAINNFMGLHLWDSWAYIQAGSWVADKWKWGHGNALQWQYMVPFKNEANAMPDNFGTTWHSPGVHMVFVGATEPSWQQYRRSGDRKYLGEVYDKLFKPLYWDNNGPTQSFGTEINAADALSAMAEELGRPEDAAHWQAFRPDMTTRFKEGWSGRWQGFYGGRGTPWKDIWALSALQSTAMPKDWAHEMIDEFVLDTDKGFASPLGVNTRAADSPPNGIFRSSTISAWLAIDGMFRQGHPHAGMLVTLNHLNGMTREWDYPVAPEAWNEEHKAWGSRYYNWDIAIVLPMIEWLAGIDYSIPDSTFTVAPNLPPAWNYIETYTPVVIDDETHWVRARVARDTTDGISQTITVDGNPLDRLNIVADTEGRKVLSIKGTGRSVATDAPHTFTSASSKASVSVRLGNKTRDEKTLAWVTPRSRIFHRQVSVSAENLVPGTTLRYTTDGTKPTPSSPVLSEPISIQATTTFTFKAFDDLKTNYKPYRATFVATELSPSQDPVGLQSGLRYEFFELEGRPTQLPDFDELKPSRTGAVPAKWLSPEIDVTKIAGKRADGFALHLYGYLKIEKDEVYNFHILGDDGARLLIDGKPVIELNTHSSVDPWEQDGNIGLKAGYHRVDLYYYQDLKRRRLVPTMRSGQEPIRQHIPADAWWTRAPEEKQ